MRVETFQFDLFGGKWSIDRLPSLDSDRTLLLGFGATEMQSRPEVFQLLRSSYPTSHLVGCSTAGEFHNGMLSDGTLSVAVLRFSQTQIVSTGVAVRRPEQSADAGRELARRLPRPGLTALLLFSEGLRIEHHELLHGLQSELGTSVPIIGALAADGRRFERTWVWMGDRIQSGLCAAIGLYGPHVMVQTGVTEEWDQHPLPTPMVSRSEGNVIFEIDGKPALDLCRTPGGGVRPLRLVGNNGAGHVAVALAIDEARRAVILTRPVVQGTRIQILPAEPEELIAGAASAAGELEASTASLTYGGGGALALTMSAIGRRIYLGDSAGREVASVASRLPNIPLVGFYTYGEFATRADASVGLHDSGLRVVMLSEDAEAERSLTDSGLTPADPSPPAAFFSEPGDAGGTSSTRLSSVRPRAKEMGAANATVYPLDNLRFIALAGTINETFDPQGMANEMTGRVVLDVAGVEHITSFGVRGWLEMMAAAESHVSVLYLANLSEAIVNQMLMVRNFAGVGQVVSFGAPYICTACSNSFEFLLDCEHSAEEIRGASPPDVACPECGNRAVFDDDPTTYFDFVLGDLSKHLPHDVRNALAERRLEWMSHVEEAIEKRLDGDRTVFRIDRKVDEKIRWQRVLSGVEGTVRLDFTRCKEATQIGADRLLAALRLETDAVKAILFDQVPLTIVEQLVRTEPIPKLQVRTISVPARCANCGVVRQAAIDPAGIREARRQGMQPEAECRRCSGSIPIVLPPEVTAFFEGERGSASGLSTTGRSRSSGGSSRALIALAVVLAVVATIALSIAMMRLL